MKRSKWILAGAAALGVTAAVWGAAERAPASPTASGGWEDSLDAYRPDKWHKADGYSNGSMFDCTWRADNAAFAGDGLLTLSLTKAADGGRDGAEYRSSGKYGYGRYEVRMKPAANPGIVSSFFTYTGPSEGEPWDEIDIEFLGKNTTQVQFNYFTNGEGGHEHVADLGFDASREFHTYGFQWSREAITWYIDGKPVHTATDNLPSAPGRVMMNLWNGTGVDSWLEPYDGQAPLYAYYDWVRHTPE